MCDRVGKKLGGRPLLGTMEKFETTDGGRKQIRAFSAVGAKIRDS
jgi:hypothetical protein